MQKSTNALANLLPLIRRNEITFKDEWKCMLGWILFACIQLFSSKEMFRRGTKEKSKRCPFVSSSVLCFYRVGQ